MSEIIIDLTIDNYTTAFDDTNLIQSRAKYEFEQKIEQLSTNSVSRSKNMNEIDRRHDSLLVNGKRGSGKTSFMLSMLKTLCAKHPKIIQLGIIDPTLLESKEHIFINILNLICQKTDCVSNDCTSEDEVKDLTKNLKEIAKGLNVLDGVGGNQLNAFDDPQIIMEEGLRSAKGGQRLEQNFHRYIEEALKYLKGDCFLLVFDDIDTSAEQGKKILELIRKYLTSPKLIVVLLGDMDLYSLIVRDLQWGKMNPEYTEKFQENKDKTEIRSLYGNEIDNLINQYLVKIIKPNNRIDLQYISELSAQIKVKSINGNIVPITDYVRENICIPLFKEQNKNINQPYLSLLLRQPVRSVVELLQASHRVRVDQSLSNQHYLISKFRNIFISELSHKYSGINNLLESLARDDPDSIIFLTKFVKDHKLWEFMDLRYTATNEVALNNNLAILLQNLDAVRY